MKAMILMVLFLSFSAQAATETHGGHVISEEGKLWLRDLKDRTSCRWLTGASFAARTSGFPEILAKIRKAHVYFASLLDSQLSQVRVCLAEADLRPVPEADQDVFLPYQIDGRQLATRVWLDDDKVSTVFIDMRLYDRLDLEQRPYLLIHELAHGLIPFSTSLRSIRLRSLVASLYEIRSQESYSREDLQLLLDASLIGGQEMRAKLENAAQSGSLADVKTALEYGVRPEDTDALYLAAINGRLTIVKLLAARLSGNKLGASRHQVADFSRFCPDRDLTTHTLGDDRFSELPQAYQYLINVGCRRPEGMLAIAEALVKIPGIDWTEKFYLQESGTLIRNLAVLSAPELSQFLLDKKLFREVLDKEALLQDLHNWFTWPSDLQLENVNREMKNRKAIYLQLYRRLGGK